MTTEELYEKGTCVYMELKLYTEPEKITEFRVIDRTEFPGGTSDGFYGSEQDGEMILYLDLGELPRDSYESYHELVRRAVKENPER